MSLEIKLNTVDGSTVTLDVPMTATVRELKAMLLQQHPCQDPIERKVLKVELLHNSSIIDEAEALNSATFLGAESLVTVVYRRNEVEAAKEKSPRSESSGTSSSGRSSSAHGDATSSESSSEGWYSIGSSVGTLSAPSSSASIIMESLSALDASGFTVMGTSCDFRIHPDPLTRREQLLLLSMLRRIRVPCLPNQCALRTWLANKLDIPVAHGPDHVQSPHADDKEVDYEPLFQGLAMQAATGAPAEGTTLTPTKEQLLALRMVAYGLSTDHLEVLNSLLLGGRMPFNFQRNVTSIHRPKNTLGWRSPPTWRKFPRMPSRTYIN